MCMSKGVPKKPEFGPCQERHGLSQAPLGKLNLNEVASLLWFVAVMVPMVSNLVKAYPNSTTAATLP